MSVKITALISIHALREESDVQCKAHCMVVALISIHALREESDTVMVWLPFRIF